MAPEALGNLEYSEATDSYSFGVLLWYEHLANALTHELDKDALTLDAPKREMMARKRPWAGMEGAHIVSSVTSNMRPQIPKDCDPMFKQIIKKCWKHNPSKRYRKRMHQSYQRCRMRK
jgi:serine/threonine protein kinase